MWQWYGGGVIWEGLLSNLLKDSCKESLEVVVGEQFTMTKRWPAFWSEAKRLAWAVSKVALVILWELASDLHWQSFFRVGEQKWCCYISACVCFCSYDGATHQDVSKNMSSHLFFPIGWFLSTLLWEWVEGRARPGLKTSVPPLSSAEKGHADLSSIYLFPTCHGGAHLLPSAFQTWKHTSCLHLLNIQNASKQELPQRSLTCHVSLLSGRKPGQYPDLQEQWNLLQRGIENDDRIMWNSWSRSQKCDRDWNLSPWIRKLWIGNIMSTQTPRTKSVSKERRPSLHADPALTEANSRIPPLKK